MFNSVVIPKFQVPVFDQKLSNCTEPGSLGKIHQSGKMLRRLLKYFWGKLPGGIRQRLIRAIQKKFTVSVAAIITNNNGKVLLLEHLLRPQASGWGIPGGFINFGEQFDAAIRREIREETGLELDDLAMIRIRTIGRHVEVMFRATSAGDPQIMSREICSFGWFDTSEMPAEMSEVQKSLVLDVLGRGNLSADLIEESPALGKQS